MQAKTFLVAWIKCWTNSGPPMQDFVLVHCKHFQLTISCAAKIPAGQLAKWPTFRMKIAQVGPQAQNMALTSQGMMLGMLTNMEGGTY